MTDASGVGPPDGRMTDAALALAAFSAVLAAGWLAAAEARMDALVAGGVGAIAVEYVLHRRRATVRRAWHRPAVKAVTAGLFVALLVAAALVAPAAGLSLLAGGLAAYLALLAGVAAASLVAR